ncbi:Sec-independent protein translocase subunit TatA [Acinetobacter sp. WU_MDCI_Abxc22]|uniref:Sec-independent protein translocase subunit TatA n=1 Tax=Acinetobacter sp. WU_MDCI_Abxc22 TaxID=2850071 RepID=UPI0021CD45AB|nr:Sec-independent protein translocase subunit TatA [Acinetobacter sp. WU_MDCI_Abxc22]MCU4361578.1 Sec-independent protein translocase subunit TatA [Acinetobacter sp. WU_MDCI_Abxc22]
MLGFSIGHLALFFIVVILIFGTAKLRNLGKDVGGAIKDFKKAVNDDSSPQLDQKDKNAEP